MSQSTNESGTKYDQGKDNFALLPWDAVRELAKVFTKGAEKYEPRNWEKGLAYSRVMSSTMRHLTDWYQKREELDPDGTGLRNIAQAAWGCVVLLSYELRGFNGSGLDDRPTLGRWVVHAPEATREDGSALFNAGCTPCQWRKTMGTPCYSTECARCTTARAEDMKKRGSSE